jgi:hypothetical protein
MTTRAMMEHAVGGAAIGAIPLADLAHVTFHDDDLRAVFDGLRREHERSAEWPVDLVNVADDIAARTEVDAAGPARFLRRLIERWDANVSRGERLGLLYSALQLAQLRMKRESVVRGQVDGALARLADARDRSTEALALLSRAVRVTT